MLGKVEEPMRKAELLAILLISSFIYAGEEDKKWSYDETGPDYWGRLDDAYATCGKGLAQSPINLTGAVPADLPELEFQYRPSPLEAVNKGHTIQVNLQPGSFLTIGEDRFQLLQFHYHALSEHTLDGDHFPMELHLVHADEAGNLAVVGIMMAIGKPNALITTLWGQIPADPRVVISSPLMINPADLLPEGRRYFRYDGSLTTPPCTEGVRWHVLTEPIAISWEQVDLFSALIGPSARPVQPLNGRKLQISRD
jgi:carbonic anhydrase